MRFCSTVAPSRAGSSAGSRQTGTRDRSSNSEREQDPISLESVEDRVGVVEVARKLFRHGEIRVRGPARFDPGYVHDTLSGQFVQRRRDTGQLGRDRKTGRFTRAVSVPGPSSVEGKFG
jgi:hypothetical protein